MRFLTTEEVRLWCHSRGLKISSRRFLSYTLENPYCFSIGLEEKPYRVIGLSDYLVPTWEEFPFEGALFWIRERGVWGDFSENTGALIFEQLRLAKGVREPLQDLPGHLFGPDELFEMHSFFILPLLFGWDAFLVPEKNNYFLFVSHDGTVEVVCRSQATYDEMYQRVRDWHPQEDKNWYFKHVDREGGLLQG